MKGEVWFRPSAQASQKQGREMGGGRVIGSYVTPFL